MKLLVVEDEHKIANAIKKGLTQEGNVVDVAYDGVEGYDLASSENYDVVILDLMLPGIDGVEICRSLRKEGNQVSILMLTAKSEIDDRVSGLNAGADDYLIKPFSFAELLARIKALSRRPKEFTSSLLKYKDLSLDTITYKVVRTGHEIKLSKKEFALLEYFLRHPKILLSKEKIIQSVWDYNSNIMPNNVEVFIVSLRKKIEGKFPKGEKLLHTVRGFGYKLE